MLRRHAGRALFTGAFAAVVSGCAGNEAAASRREALGRAGSYVIFSCSAESGRNISTQAGMNDSFDPSAVNTYGARQRQRERYEGVLKALGRSSEAQERWLEYDSLSSRAVLDGGSVGVATYQYRLDWQMWFAALGHSQQPWILRVSKLLEETRSRSLLARTRLRSARRAFVSRASTAIAPR